MAIALSSDPIEEATDPAVRWTDRLLVAVAILCIVAVVVLGVVRLLRLL